MKLGRLSFDEAYMNSHKLGLDDTFQFHCKACGKCCKHREDVILTPYDLFRIARYLGRTPSEVIERYCDTYDGPDSHMPIVHIKPDPPDNACPFLRDRRCIIHKDKPLVCASYPLSRISGRDKPFYVLQPGIKCGASDRTVSVREWLGPLCNEESELFGTRWFDSVNALVWPLRSHWPTMDVDRQKELLTIFYNLLYLSYDVKKPFLPQFEFNISGLLLYGITTYGIIDVPGWVPIPQTLPEDMKYLLLLRKAYLLYKKDWCARRGVELHEVDEETGIQGGCCYVCLGEFEGAEFADEGYMKYLLSVEDFTLWQSHPMEV